MNSTASRGGAKRVARAAALAGMAWALVMATVLPIAPASASSAPSSVTLTRGNGFIDVSWPTVSNATGANIVYSTNEKQSWTRAATGTAGTPSGGNTTYRLANTNNLLPYYVAVSLVYSGTSSGWTNSARLGPALSPLPARNVAVTRTTVNSSPALDVAWDQCNVSETSCNGGVAVTGYYVNLSTNGGHSWTREQTITSPTNGQDNLTISTGTGADGADRYTVRLSTGISTSESYIASVGLENAVGVSWVNSASVAATTTPPANVTSLTVHRAVSSLVLEWPPVTGATGYDIVYSSNDRQTWTRAVSNTAGTYSGTNLTYTISSGIDNSSTYYVGIRPRSSGGAGGWTNSAEVLSAITPRPAWHLDVTRSNNALSVIWQQCDVNARFCNGGSEITSFAINLSSNGGATWTRAKTFSDPDSDSDVTVGSDRWTVALSSNITNATQYLVSVGVRNRMGTSWVNYGPIPAFTS